MDNGVLVALLGFAGTLLGSLLGVVAAQKLTQYRLAQLEEKVSKHNSIVERTYILEGQMTECIHDIKDLKTIVTLVVMAVFAVLALRGSIEPDQTMLIISMVVSFYFGTQHEKSAQ